MKVLLILLLLYNSFFIVINSYFLHYMDTEFLLYWYAGFLEIVFMVLILLWKRIGIYGIVGTTMVLSWINYTNLFLEALMIGMILLAIFFWLLRKEYQWYEDFAPTS